MDDNTGTNGGTAAGVAGSAHTGDLTDAGGVPVVGDAAKHPLHDRMRALERAVIDGFYGGNRRRYEDEHGINTSDDGTGNEL